MRRNFSLSVRTSIIAVAAFGLALVLSLIVNTNSVQAATFSFPTDCVQPYTVQKNDTLWSLATVYHKDVEDLIRINGLDRKAQILEAQQICLATNITATKPGHFVTVKVYAKVPLNCNIYLRGSMKDGVHLWQLQDCEKYDQVQVGRWYNGWARGNTFQDLLLK